MRLRKAGGDVQGALSVPPGADAELHRLAGARHVQVLRLRRGRRRDHVRREARAARLHRRDRVPRAAASRSRSSTRRSRRRPSRSAAARDRLASLLERAAGFYERVLWESDAGAGAREYLAGRGLRRGGLPRSSGSATRPAARRSASGLAARATRATSCSPRGSRTGVATTTSSGASSSRSPTGAAPCVGFQARKLHDDDPLQREVRQLARERPLPQGRRALRPRSRPADDREGGPRRRRRGERRRDRAPAGRVPARRRVDGDRADRGAAAGARTADEAAVPVLRRGRRRPGRDAPRHAARRATRASPCASCAPGGPRPGRRPGRVRAAAARARELRRCTRCGSSSSGRATGKPRSRRSGPSSRRCPTRPSARTPSALAADLLDLPPETQAGLAPARGSSRAAGVVSPRLLDAGSRLERRALAGVAAHPSLLKILGELGPEHFDDELHRRARGAPARQDEPADGDLTPLLAELYALADTEEIGVETAEQLLLQVRARGVQREIDRETDDRRRLALYTLLGKIRTRISELL